MGVDEGLYLNKRLMIVEHENAAIFIHARQARFAHNTITSQIHQLQSCTE